MKTFLKYYWLVSIITIAIWMFVGARLGFDAMVVCIILTLLEVTISADNAIVNSRVLVTLSPFWQTMFMTVGIFIAVFVVRFILPIVIVMIGAGLSFGQTLDLAFNNPDAYSEKLDSAEPLINGFGASFLLLVACEFFIHRHRRVSWITLLEQPFVRLAEKVPGAYIWFAVTLMFISLVFLPQDIQPTVLRAMIAATALHTTLTLIGRAMERTHKKTAHITHKTGMAALVAFIYLEVLDASFSLDGVIGAFALTNNIIIIMAGLGAGAVWVREMTRHLVHTNALVRFHYLEHGAHWAILCLSIIMLSKLYRIHIPEIIVGCIGLIFISAAIYTSIQTDKHFIKSRKQ